MTQGELLKNIKKTLKQADIESSRLDSELIVMEAVPCTRVQLITREDDELPEEAVKRAEKMLERRLLREPMQYILGRCEFMALPFELTADTLIPRGDTECLVEAVLTHINNSGARTVLDIGTGSGAVIISLAVMSDISGTAVDISEGALVQAQKNAVLNGVSERIKFLKSDLFSAVEGRFDIIVSNPPYIRTDVIPTLDGQVKDYEPVAALDGGEDGLDFYRRIARSAPLYLESGGLIAFEIGFDQADEVRKILENENFYGIIIGKDLAGLDRTVIARLK